MAMWQWHCNQITDFGKFMDPLADKCLVMAALCCLVEQGQMWGWILALVLVREFAVSGMRLVAVEQGKVIAAAVWQGENCRHHGVYLPDAGGGLTAAANRESRLPTGDFSHHGLLWDGVLYPKIFLYLRSQLMAHRYFLSENFFATTASVIGMRLVYLI